MTSVGKSVWAAIALVWAGQLANAAQCSDYEQEVLDVSMQVKAFQKSSSFKEWGWATAGPFHQTLKRLQHLSDAPEAQEFFAKHEFAVMQIYQVADEYRTEGKLDDFYRDLEETIGRFRCRL